MSDLIRNALLEAGFIQPSNWRAPPIPAPPPPPHLLRLAHLLHLSHLSHLRHHSHLSHAVLTAAILTMYRAPLTRTKWTLASRTDKGVHAVFSHPSPSSSPSSSSNNNSGVRAKHLFQPVVDIHIVILLFIASRALEMA